jgi:threonine dehydrogenase-like Zn-dependent dehydrogenase
MRAVRNSGGSVHVVDVDEPAGPGVLVQVAAVGICASDLKYLRMGSEQIAGHELSGTLEDGTAVAVEAIFGCSSCPRCERGSYNLCDRGPTALGLTDPGGMCEWFRAPAHALTPLPAGLRPADASLVEPAAVAWHACRVGGVDPDARVAVVGAGAIGVLAAAVAQSMGANDVSLAARRPHQHTARERLGVGEPTSDHDVVIDCTGSEAGLFQSVALSRPGGTVVHLGAHDAGTRFPLLETFLREIAVKPSLGYSTHDGQREFAQAARMVADRPDLVDILITHRFGIDDAPQAFAVASDRSSGAFRVVVEPGGPSR